MKTSALKARSKWTGITPNTGAGLREGKTNAFLHGFRIVEGWGAGFGIVHVPVIVGGRFSFAGRIYG